MKRFIYHLTPCLLIIVGIITVSGPAKTSAVSASDWKAGRIIDDSVFTNSTSMTAQEVQNFLNARVPVCDTNGTQLTGRWYAAAGRYYTRAEWGALNGNPAPFTCLKDFWEVPKTDPAPGQPANNYGGAAIPAGAKSAAQIIWDAAQRYQISPKVLLTTIQKESYGPLTSDDWPYRSQYEYPMGAYCPDTAPCDPNYEGFSIQIYESARLFRYYLNNMGQSWWPYKKPNQVNSILYNPNSACGSSNVFIESSATAALYTYTPYQPNAAALANMYGTGDGCSAYGNRNFWRIFSDWFGTTESPSFDWSLISQSLYTDSTKTAGASTNIIFGNKLYAEIKIKNTGNQTWNREGTNTIRLGSFRPAEHSSKFCDPSWLSCSRAAAMQETTVGPNETATFSFWLKAPNQAGLISEYFVPVIEGVAWLKDIGMFYQLNVQPATYSWSMASQYAYTDTTKTVVANMNALAPGQKVYVGFTARNTGNMTWLNSGPNAIMSGTASPLERQSLFAAGSSWLTVTRPSLMKEASVLPGQIGTFEFWLTVPVSGVSGVSNERFNLIANGLTWMNDVGLSYYMNVQK